AIFISCQRRSSPTNNSVHPLFFNAPAPPQTYPLSLHDALPISSRRWRCPRSGPGSATCRRPPRPTRCSTRSSPTSNRARRASSRSEEHTSELQSRGQLVCRLLLEKKKKKDHVEPRKKQEQPITR